MARHEKIIKRTDGLRVKIIANVYLDCVPHRPPIYSTEVFVCRKHKRTFTPVFDANRHEYRSLNKDDRAKYRHMKKLEVVSEEELYQALVELWESMKPTKVLGEV